MRANGALEGHRLWDEGKEVGSSLSWRKQKGRSEIQESEQVLVGFWCSLQLKWVLQPIHEWGALWKTFLALQFHPVGCFRSWVPHSMFPARMLGNILFLIPWVVKKRWRGKAQVQKVGLGCLHQLQLTLFYCGASSSTFLRMLVPWTERWPEDTTSHQPT